MSHLKDVRIVWSRPMHVRVMCIKKHKHFVRFSDRTIFSLLKYIIVRSVIVEDSEVHFGSVRNLGRLRNSCFTSYLSFIDDFSLDLGSNLFIWQSIRWDHPRVLINLINSGSSVCIIWENSFHEVFKFCTQVCSLHFLPVDVSLTSHE